MPHRRSTPLLLLITLSFGVSCFAGPPPNTTPAFVGAISNLSVYRSSGVTDVRALLHVSDTDGGQTLTWAQDVAPAHGILSFSNATASAGGTDISADGAITYLPALGYFGPDNFIVQVSDGEATATRMISITVDSDTASTGSGSPSAVNNFQPTATLTWLIATQGIFPDQSDNTASVDSYLGEIRLVSCDSSAINGGWLPCDGRLLNINVNQALFSLLGTTFGGNGTTQFRLPDLRGRVPVGSGQGNGLTDRALGASGGQEGFTLATANLPSHSHSYIPGNTGLAGDGEAIDNMQPWLALNFCIVRNGPSDALGWVRIFAFNFTPGGHYAADGAVLSIASETDLFSLLGTTYGGNGVTTFALPDLRGRTPIGVGTGGGLTTRVLGEAGGSEEIALLESEIPAHTHAYSSGTTGSTGGNQSHDTMQPFLTLNVAVSPFGVYGQIGEASQPGIAEVRIWATDSAIRNGIWLPCNGSLQPIVEQETLFALIGTIYGGDSQSTFALPDSSGRAIVNAGQGAGLAGRILGETWGHESETVGLLQLPAHTHFFNAPPTDISLSNNSVNNSGGVNAIVGVFSTTDADIGDSHSYSLVSGIGSANNSSFNLSGSTLRAANASAMAPGNYTVRIQSDDGNGGVYAEAFSITVVDDIAPAVTSVIVPVNGSYTAGQALDFTVRFTEDVLVTDTPVLSLTIGSTVRSATYVSGTGSSNLVFGYRVAAGDFDPDGIAFASSSIALNGGTIRDAGGNDATLTFSSPSTTGVLVDAVAPEISSITRLTPSAQLVRTNTTVFQVTFTEAVTGVAASWFAVTPINGSTVTGAVMSVSGGPAVYEVTVSVTAGVGDFRLEGVTPPLTVTTFATGFGNPTGLARDSAGNLFVANNASNTVSKVSPEGVVSTFATGINSPYGLAVDVAGNVYVSSGSTIKKVTTGGVVSTFATGFNSPLGLAFDGAGNLYVANNANNTVSKVTSGGVVSTFATGFTTPMDLAFDRAGNLYVANQANNTVSKVTTNGVVTTFATGFRGPIGMAFDSAGNLYVANNSVGLLSITTINGVVSDFIRDIDPLWGLAMDPADNLYWANYTDNTVSRLALGQIKDPAGNTLAGLPYSSGDYYTLLSNTAPTDIALSANLVNESSGANVLVGTFTTIDADTNDTHTYTIVSGPGDTNNASFAILTNALHVGSSPLPAGDYSVRIQTDDGNGGTYAEAFTITVVDDVAPIVSSVSAPSAGSYQAGQNLDFILRFTEVVSVTGTPALSLTIGSTARGASYFSGSGSSNLVFRHTVAEGDNDADGIASASPVVLNGGTLQDATGHDAIRTFTPPDTSAVFVDTVAPGVVSILRQSPSGSNIVSGFATWRVTFSEPVSGVDVNDFLFTQLGGNAFLLNPLISGGPSVYDVTAEYGSGVSLCRLDLKPAGTGIADTALNAISGGYTNGEIYNFDNEGPVVNQVDAPGNGTYGSGQSLDFLVYFNEPTTITGSPSIELTIGSTARSASYFSGSGSNVLVFRYTVQAGDSDADGIASTSSFALNGGTIQDAAANDATLTFSSPSLTGVLVDAVAPEVASITRRTPSAQTVMTNTVVFEVTFTEAVTNVDTNWFVVTPVGGSVAAGPVASVSGGPTVYDVTVSVRGGAGEFRLDAISNLLAAVSIQDLAGNALAGLPFTSGETYLYQPNAVPTDLTLSSSTVNQSAGTNAIVGTLTTTDADTGDTFTYSLEAGAGDTNNAAFNISGSTLRANDPMALAVGNVSVRIRTDDGHGGVYARAFSITVTAQVGNRFVGIDFDQINGLSPANWTKIISSGQTVYLTDETGSKSVLRFTNSTGLTYFNAIPGANTIPMHSTSLRDIGGNLYAFGTNATITAKATGLKSGVTYKIWVFAVRSGGLTDQTVTIQGSGAPLTFRQQGGDTNLVVNDSVGSSSNDLSDYAKFVTADSNGEISVVVVAEPQVSGQPLFVLAGLAIQGDIDLLPEISSPLNAAGTNGVAFDYRITASGGTASHFDAVGLPAGLSVNADTGGISGTPTQAGSFSVLLSATNEFGDAGSATLTLTIAKATATVSLTGLIQTYDGVGKAVTVSTLPESLPVDITYNGSSTVPTNAGLYVVVGTINDTNFAGSSTNMLEVQKASLSVTADNASRKYGEANPVLTGTLLGVIIGDNLTASYGTAATPTSPAGLYPIVPTVVDPDHRLANYAVALNDGSLTITSDDAPIITLATNRVTYTENADPVRLDVAAIVTDGGSLDFDGGTLTITLTANGEATDILSVRDQGVGDGEIDLSANEVSFGGLFFGMLTGGDGTNALVFNFSADATPAAVSALLQNLTFASTSDLPSTNARIAEFVLTDGDGGTSAPVWLMVEVVAVPDSPILAWTNPAAITYGTALDELQFNPTASVLGAFEFSPAPGTVLPAGSNQTLTAVFIPDDLVNYTMATSQVSITVLKAMLTATALDQVRNYADGNPALTIDYTGFVNGDTLAAIDTPPTASTTATTNNNVGTYPITLAGGGDDNYALNLVDGTLTITTVPLLLVVNDASRLYGESNPTFSGTILQTRNGDTFNASYATTATAASPEGTYLITGTVLDRNNKLTNYTVTVTEGLLTIGKVMLTATANNLSRAYGAANPTLTITYTGFLNGDDASTLTAAPTASTSATTNSSLGDYPITLSGGVDNRYTIVLVSGTLTVGKAPLLITADSLSKPYGASNPALTLSYAGLVNGETADALDTAPTVATTATTDSTAGAYPITLTGGHDDHYAITLAGGTLTVVPDAEFGIALLSAPTTYLRRNPPVKLDAGATLDAGGRPHFGGGQLTVTIISNAAAGDVLAVYPQGTDASLIGLVGDTVFIGDAPLARMTRPAGPADPLVLDLSPNATPEALQGLVRDLSFVTTNGLLTSRVVELSLTDGHGGRSFPSQKTVVIDRVPAIPPFSGSLSNLARLPRGQFNGLILRTNDILPERSGYFRLTVQPGLGYSGFFSVGGRRTLVSGRFNDNGQSARLTTGGDFGLELELVPETDQVRGTLTSYRGGGWSSELFGHRAGFATTNPAAQLKGAYTLSLPGSSDPSIASVGNGYATVTVDGLGNLGLSGRLADGQLWSQNVLVSSNALWPICVSLDRQRGIIIGWLRLDGSAAGDITGMLTWIKPRSSFYPNGFAAELQVSGSRFIPVTTTAPALSWGDGRFQIYGGNLLNPATNDIMLSRVGNLVDFDGPIRQLSLSLNPRNGVFTGQFLHPLSRRTTRYRGILLQNRDLGTGFFLGLNQGGLVRLTTDEE